MKLIIIIILKERNNVFCRVEELMLSLDESSDTLNKNLKEKEKENKNLERR